VNVEEYISSGIVETCVLGLASPDETEEFERMCAAHSEVRAARDSFELRLETNLLREATQPPKELKSRIFSEIGMESEEKAVQTASRPKPVLIPRAGYARYVAAASFILLAGSVLINLYLLNQYKKSIAQYQELLSSQNVLVQNNQVLQTRLESFQTAISLMKNPYMAIVKLGAVEGSPAPHGMATVYWNSQSKDVYLLVNQLPKPSSEKQYQLWAMVDGKPVDAGMIDMNEAAPFMKLKNIPRAEAFAITLEKKGGSPVPTMDALYVMGKVTG